MAELFQKGRTTITEHLQHIFEVGELKEKSVCRKFRHTDSDGKEYLTTFYNLDVIISGGYRVKSHHGRQILATPSQELTMAYGNFD
ncbi:RhuM family protein [Parapedobacter sp. 2B3]|uniref:RhuM family protein n=1 Tax=Parapedobacter sp. 2B3 TaxID=3342381 RepID=UPI0035B61B4C